MRLTDFAGEGLVKATSGEAIILELEGSTGSSPANDRKKGFDDVMAQDPGMKIMASQSGDFNRDMGRQVAEYLLQAHPEAAVIYAHYDEMAIGAISAIEPAGKKLGKDILIVSIDGQKKTACRRSLTARSVPPSNATCVSALPPMLLPSPIPKARKSRR